MRSLALAAVLCLQGAAWGADEAALMQRGEELVMGRCFLCHGATGDSSSPLYPKLAGQNIEYMRKQLRNFKRGERESSDMRKVVAELDENEMQAAAFFLSRQQPSRGNSAYAEMRAVGEKLFAQGDPARGLKPCRECHGDNGAGSATLPRIAGQHTLYVETQLTLFEERKRTNDNAQMQDIAKRLTTDEIRALAEYLRSL
ncbi:MAG: cytochrome c4 [Dechloromonas sp.]|uniref:Cytochrome c4 n=1 Tax=Candidatus Dechloromonas phosphorivorans TaxID=2899244 RepID=A0A9D7QL65_9RHOO|nr:cytochrome c4 [Candidatus Dechloromonas phosphorivorans]